jgi:hypothetical protein
MVPETGAFEVLVATNGNTVLLPAALRLIAVLLFVQLNVVPGIVPLKVIAVVVALLHNTWSVGFATVGIGFTVTTT